MSVSSVAPRVVIKRREQITALPLYYYGDLQMKREGEQDFKNFFAELRGCTIFLYADPKHDSYSEKVHLQNLKAITLDKPGMRSSSLVYILSLQNEEIHLKIDSQEAGEEWRGFITTVAYGPASFQLEIPQDLQLLPGQMVRIQDVLEQEIQRINASHASEYRDPLSFPQTIPDEAYEDVVIQMPPCFSTVSREEAEMMLEDHPEYGSIILRPATDGINYAVTIRQLFDRNSVIKHYRVRSQDRSFVIELNSPVTVSNLYDVVQYFLTETSHRLKPFVQPQNYDSLIVRPSERIIFPKRPSGATASKARVSPAVQSPTLLAAQPSSPRRSPVLIHTPDDEADYIIPDVM
ncbi:signal-transducing adaptor protein 1-like isoform X2 [Paramormyrops kingsleyae]|uniref:signal-transducing adaptor protein 1-like isoform X2 n=1 Tax=Paramormyrops kingsleyae TaxID=1676925 RepID=UPI000CD5DCCB|nr:signal-transducing adaptor protein 1-like isoform X2 [Paramormyrops kingsleyae]